jgi:hypothetical protein
MRFRFVLPQRSRTSSPRESLDGSGAGRLYQFLIGRYWNIEIIFALMVFI